MSSAFLTTQRRQIIAAGLLIASLVLPLALFAVPLLVAENPQGGLLIRYAGSPWSWLASAAQFAVTPVGNVVSLLLADRRQLWPKLNYVVLALWLLVGLGFLGLYWMPSNFNG